MKKTILILFIAIFLLACQNNAALVEKCNSCCEQRLGSFNECTYSCEDEIKEKSKPKAHLSADEWVNAECNIAKSLSN